MTFFRALFSTKSDKKTVAPDIFLIYAARAIQVIISDDGQINDKQLVDLFQKGFQKKEAVELLLFLPAVFCQYMLPEIKWPSYYLEYLSENKSVKVQYADNAHFGPIQNAMKSYLAGGFIKKDFLKIAGRSASFKAINQLLNNGGELEDVIVTPEYIVR